MSVILLAGAAIYIVMIAKYKQSYHDLDADLKQALDPNNGNSYLLGYIAALSFFLLTFAYLVLKMFDQTKKYSKWVLLGAGVVAVSLMAASIGLSLASQSSAYALDVMCGHYNQDIANAIAVSQGQGLLVGVPYSDWVTLNPGLQPLVDVVNAHIQTAKDTAFYEYFGRVVELVTQLIVFGLLPLLYAVKKVVCKHEIHVEKKVETKEVKSEPAKAAVKPAAKTAKK